MNAHRWLWGTQPLWLMEWIIFYNLAQLLPDSVYSTDYPCLINPQWSKPWLSVIGCPLLRGGGSFDSAYFGATDGNVAGEAVHVRTSGWKHLLLLGDDWTPAESYALWWCSSFSCLLEGPWRRTWNLTPSRPTVWRQRLSSLLRPTTWLLLNGQHLRNQQRLCPKPAAPHCHSLHPTIKVTSATFIRAIPLKVSTWMKQKAFTHWSMSRMCTAPPGMIRRSLSWVGTPKRKMVREVTSQEVWYFAPSTPCDEWDQPFQED